MKHYAGLDLSMETTQVCMRAYADEYLRSRDKANRWSEVSGQEHNPRHRASLPVFHNQRQGRVETELVAKCLGRLLELLAIHRDFGRDDEVP